MRYFPSGRTKSRGHSTRSWNTSTRRTGSTSIRASSQRSNKSCPNCWRFALASAARATTNRWRSRMERKPLDLGVLQAIFEGDAAGVNAFLIDLSGTMDRVETKIIEALGREDWIGARH